MPCRITFEGPLSEIVTDTFADDHHVEVDSGALLVHDAAGRLVKAYGLKTWLTVDVDR